MFAFAAQKGEGKEINFIIQVYCIDQNEKVDIQKEISVVAIRNFYASNPGSPNTCYFLKPINIRSAISEKMIWSLKYLPKNEISESAM